jgi:uncharacterized protein
MATPYIHCFECYFGKFIYDVNTDTILQISDDTFEELQIGKVNMDNPEITGLVNSGFLSTNRVVHSIHPETKYLDCYYKNKINYVILQVTQECNLACKYCVYSESYLTRKCGPVNMSFETAKKSLDYLLDHSADADEIKVGFYGGEPLIRFDLIRKCVNYIKENTQNEEVMYNMTTNATLIDEEIADFLIDNRFYLNISLDGPQNIHDKSRVFRSTGKGSFNRVMDNLSIIRRRNPEYYQKYVHFNAVITASDGFDKINKFFDEEPLVKNQESAFSIISDSYVKQKVKYGRKFTREYGFAIFKLLFSILHKERNIKLSKFIFNSYKIQAFERATHKHQQLLFSCNHHGGPCVPGIKRLFVSTEGVFYPCEKILGNDFNAKIGDIKGGVQTRLAKHELNIESWQETDCRSCWAYRYCTVCIAAVLDANCESIKSMNDYCSEVKQGLEVSFVEYIVLNKLGLTIV